MTHNALILTDTKPGHENQSKALCNGMEMNPSFIRTTYRSSFHKFLSYIFDWIGLRTLSLYRPVLKKDLVAITEPPSCIIGTGSNTFYALKTLARHFKVPSIAILNPSGYNPTGFDIIINPIFDDAKPLPNRITVPINLTPARTSFYIEQTSAFLKRYTPHKPDAIGVIIGGPNPFSSLEVPWLKAQLDALFAATPDYEHWVTTSRRTPTDIETLLDDYPFDYKLIFSLDTFNPIPAFVARCQHLFVTADSTGMLSEAVSTGNAAVEILDNITKPQSKFGRFVAMLDDEGYAHRFDGTLGTRCRKVSTADIYAQVKQRLFDIH